MFTFWPQYTSHPHQRMPALLLAVLLCIAITTSIYVSAETFDVIDGFEKKGVTFSTATTLNLLALVPEVKVSSTALIENCKIEAGFSISGSKSPSGELTTSLYMKFLSVAINNGRFFPSSLLPNMLLHLTACSGDKRDTEPIVRIGGSWMKDNTTILIENSHFTFADLNTNTQILLYWQNPTSGTYSFSDHCLVHVRDSTATGSRGFLRSYWIDKPSVSPFTLSQESAIVLENVQCIQCRLHFIYFDAFVLKDHSAFIVRNALNKNPTTPADMHFFTADSAITVDETSTISLIDIDNAHNFAAATAPTFKFNTISGKGTVVFARVSMQKSGLTTMQPSDPEIIFWVSAQMKANTPMTPVQLRAQNLRAVDSREMTWDGKGLDGKCVPAGAIPGRAEYDTSSGKTCDFTCLNGFEPPACIPPPVAQKCNVPNCELCYRVDKSKCKLCDPSMRTTHTTDLKHCYLCSVENCATCTADNKCGTCITGYLPSATGDSCIPCVIDKCTRCSSAGVCDRCPDKYTVTDKACIPCDIAECGTCSAPGVCQACNGKFKPSADKKSCIHCDVPHCEVCGAADECSSCSPTSTPVGKGCVLCEVAGCDTCDTENHCSDCKDKHTKKDGQCIPCDIDQCESCSSAGVCQDCAPHYNASLGGATCFLCDLPGCAECESPGKCNQCLPKHTKKDGQCISCDVDHCTSCTAAEKCETCATGYKVSKDFLSCLECAMPGCDWCTADRVCGGCADGYTLADDKKSCIECSIENCDSCASTNICKHCKTQYTPSKDGLRCTECAISGCTRCDIGGVCALCDPLLSVSLDAGKCVSCNIDDCTFCSDKNDHCSMCACGMVPAKDGGSCVICTAAHCTYCDVTGDGTKCAQCDGGYELSGGSCKKSSLPQWAVFLIVVAITIVTAAAGVVAVFLFMRHQAHQRQVELDAEERRKNRLTQGKGGRQRMEIAIVDLGDIEGAASGIRDTQKQYNLNDERDVDFKK